MIINQIHVRGYKALADLKLELPRFGALVGPNDSGKTSILETIALGANSIALMNPPAGQQVNYIGGWSMEALTPDLDSYSLRVRSESGLEVGMQLADVRQLRWVGSRPNAANFRYELPQNFNLVSLPVHIYRLIPVRLKSPSVFGYIGERLGDDGHKLPSVLYELLGLSRSRFARVEARLRSIVPTIQEIVVGPMNVSPKGPLGQGLWFNTQTATKVPASLISDGTILLLGYLTLLEMGGLEPLLIEEPETGIHPFALGELIKFLRQAVEQSSDLQVLMTTHSPYLLDHLKPEEVILTRRGEDGFTQAAKLSELPDLEDWTRVMSPGEIWTSGGEDDLINRIRSAG